MIAITSCGWLVSCANPFILMDSLLIEALLCSESFYARTAFWQSYGHLGVVGLYAFS